MSATVTPVASAAPAAAAPSAPSAPASTPSTPVSTPSTPPPAAPAAPATPAAPDTRSTFEVIRDKISEGFDPNGTGGAPAKDVPGDKNVEVPAGETPGQEGGQQKDGAKPEGEQQGDKGAQGEESFFDSYDPTGAIAVDELRTAISEDPALAAAIEAKPELKNKLFANARLAERATRYDEIIGSPDEATVAVEGYTALGNMSDLLGQIEDGKPQSIAPFIEAMVERSALRDENGEVLRRQDGSIVTDGSVGKLLKNFFLGEMQAGIAEATAKGDDDALAAYDVVMERSGLRPSTANDDQSDELKSQREALEAERRQLTEQRERDASVATQAFEQRVIEATDKVLNGSIDSIVKRATGLSDFERTTVIRNIHNRLATLVGTNRSYKTQRATIERLPLGQKRQTEMTRLNTRFINDHLWTIATEALENAGHSITTKAEQRQQRQAAREESSRAENRGSLPLAQGGAQSGPDQQFSIPQIEADLKARNNGRTPSVQEILTEKVLRKQRAAAGGTR